MQIDITLGQWKQGREVDCYCAPQFPDTVTYTRVNCIAELVMPNEQRRRIEVEDGLVRVCGGLNDGRVQVTMREEQKPRMLGCG